MLTHPLASRLRQLKLSGMLLSLENRAAQAADGQLSPTEFLALLLDDELERRNQARFSRAMQESGIEASKTLAQFDFSAAPQLNRTLILELANAGFVGRGENILLCGPTGTGKSHLSHALAFEALKRDHSVWVRPAHRLFADLNAARADGGYRRRFGRLCALDLLVIDDLGLRPLSPQASEDLYEIVRERYERHSLIITSNRALHEWPEVFSDSLLASAALDRLTHPPLPDHRHRRPELSPARAPEGGGAYRRTCREPLTQPTERAHAHPVAPVANRLACRSRPSTRGRSRWITLPNMGGSDRAAIDKALPDVA